MLFLVLSIWHSKGIIGMKNLILIAFMSLAAPMSAAADQLRNCEIVVTALIGFKLADAPSSAYEAYKNVYLSQLVAKRDTRAVSLLSADMVIYHFFEQLGRQHIQLAEGKRQAIKHFELYEAICDTELVELFRN